MHPAQAEAKQSLPYEGGVRSILARCMPAPLQSLQSPCKAANTTTIHDSTALLLSGVCNNNSVKKSITRQQQFQKQQWIQ